MEVEELDSVVGLEQVAVSWEETCNGRMFGIETKPHELLRSLEELTKNPNEILFGLKENGKYVGLMGLRTYKNPIGTEKIADEHYWYVMPEYRSGGLKLLREARKWAIEQGCSHFIVNASNLASDLHDKICGFYERLGMKKFETTYIEKLGGK